MTRHPSRVIFFGTQPNPPVMKIPTSSISTTDNADIQFDFSFSEEHRHHVVDDNDRQRSSSQAEFFQFFHAKRVGVVTAHDPPRCERRCDGRSGSSSTVMSRSEMSMMFT
jgi:hypothetical protein